MVFNAMLWMEILVSCYYNNNNNIQILLAVFYWLYRWIYWVWGVFILSVSVIVPSIKRKMSINRKILQNNKYCSFWLVDIIYRYCLGGISNLWLLLSFLNSDFTKTSQGPLSMVYQSSIWLSFLVNRLFLIW